MTHPDETTADTALPPAAGHAGLLTTPLHTLPHRAPATPSPQISIRAAAERMRDERVSSLLLVQDGHLFGLLADRDLRDTPEFLCSLRTRHQARQIAGGLAADNFLPPEELSHFERSTLKDAFGVVKTLQDVLAQRYPSNR
jgi:signal-transduction protein with cAMP-binding, CBS, and nucleotidyltransferase domain